MGKGFKKVLNGTTDALGMTDSKAADRAIRAQRGYVQDANKHLDKMYGRAEANLSPWRNAGLDSLKQLQNYGDFEGSSKFTMADFQKDPGHQFRLDEAMKQIERGRAAKGSLSSGAAFKDLLRYSQDYASNEYQNAYNRHQNQYANDLNLYNNKWNRISQLANYGQNADTTLANVGVGMGSKAAENMVGLGNAAGAAELNRNNDMKELWKQGAQMAAMAACWVARAVFGEDNPKWLMARRFILHIGPKWFKRLYLKHGEEFAKVVKRRPLLKLALRPVFETFAYLGSRGVNKSEFNRGGQHAR